MNQAVIDRAVDIATRAAMSGNPVERVMWVPPTTATDDPIGMFVIIYAPRHSAAEGGH